MTVLLRCLQVLGLNAVPAGGFLLGAWSWDTALALYWFENLFGGLLIGLRIALHRRWTGKRGHFRAHALGAAQTGDKKLPKRAPGSFLASFLAPTLIVTLAHGLFVGFALRRLLPGAAAGTASEPLRSGVLALAGLLLVGFCIDLVQLREWPFARLKDLAEYHLGRVVLVHLAILGGFVFMTWRGHEPQRFYLAFAALKTMADLSTLLFRAAGVERLEMDTPPSWLAGAMNRMESKYRGEDFETYWHRAREQERELAADDEQVQKAPRRRGSP